MAYYYYGKKSRLSEWRSKVSLAARKKMYDLFIQTCQPQATDKVIDVGVTPDDAHKESNFFEALYPYKENITATSVDDAKYLEEKYFGLTFVQTEPYSLPFNDQHFDCLFCNAVVGHTGSREQQTMFLQECIRVSKKFFITTPNRWFPIETHSILPIFHWLPAGAFRWIVRRLGKNELAQESRLNLLGEKDLRKVLGENVGYSIRKLKTFGFVSNLLIINKGAM